MPRKRITVTNESASGRNLNFHDNYTGKNMTLKQFVNKIDTGNYDSYHIRKINNVRTPASNPDGKEGNNLD